MSTKFPGGFITKSPPLPSGPFENSTARGIWTLDQAMQLKKQGLWPTAGNIAPLVIGQVYAGGFYAGQISTTADGVATHNLVVGPLSTASTSARWKNEDTSTSGANSNINGPQNTADMVADGNSTVYPAAHFCNNLVTGGFSDWYMPAKNELEVCYFNLKPSTTSNNTSSGANSNAVPVRASNYTSGNPAQTSATIFRVGGSETFGGREYWSSTQVSATQALQQYFGTGGQYQDNKFRSIYVRAIRRVPV